MNIKFGIWNKIRSDRSILFRKMPSYGDQFVEINNVIGPYNFPFIKAKERR
jgi:hypothetical protein